MAALSPKDVARAAELNRILNHAAYAYYALDNPELTDAEFDRLLIELQQLEAAYPELVTEDSYTQRVGGYVSEQFEPVQHAARMYSMMRLLVRHLQTLWHIPVSLRLTA